ncbi:beta-1,3-galactosyltransferase 5-like [Mizuhopecten yessoensis]|uniref:Hexosyltransferase n=1 Tax=Mizuhopecten yessoensis TaxID=6573 RepID=A0A210QWB6_MIZYE|nr:beta-1,3-galactosyltransferase 5-like [Mizuhopecten yessoensis]XP_021348108.1 beta-1,3-galactosyltransferase 5-like [Mizuhopecten yessoensis]OWF52966.1 Lactosylceramide 1,3-N-acetyl-beta-D-glucosaminyltransferase A [Mizuhopecten yessoensis]
MHRLVAYTKFASISMLVATTLLTVTFLHEIYRPDVVMDSTDMSTGKDTLARWILGNDDDDEHKEHIVNRQIKAKTVYAITVNAPYNINNRNICRGVDKVSVLVVVHTAPDHFFIRSEMRRTWLNTTFYSPESVRVVFLLGLVTTSTLQVEIEKESDMHRDIVQGSFIDSYRNLTNKGVMGYRWITENCLNAEMVIKVDDDSLINFFKYFEEMRNILVPKKKHIFCNRIEPNTMPIIRKRNSKWFVRPDDYRSYSMYPHRYCSGFVVFISTDLVPALFHAAIGSPFFWVDDFYLFGLLPSMVKNVTFDNYRGNLTFSHPEGLKCYQKEHSKCKYLVMPAKNKEIDVMWKAVIEDRQQSSYGYYYMRLNPLQQNL